MRELGEALRAIFEKLGEFFDLFDLSFIVSGTTTLAAFTLLATRINLSLAFLPSGWLLVVSLLLSSYVLGLICFAIGRWFRMGVAARRSHSSFYTHFTEVLAAHGLDAQSPFVEYLARKKVRGDWRLYVRLWAGVRQETSMLPSLLLLKRYWVMAATYDGLATALSLWAAILVACSWTLPMVGSLPR